MSKLLAWIGPGLARSTWQCGAISEVDCLKRICGSQPRLSAAEVASLASCWISASVFSNRLNNEAASAFLAVQMLIANLEFCVEGYHFTTWIIIKNVLAVLFVLAKGVFTRRRNVRPGHI